MTKLEGRVSWAGFISSMAPTLATLLASLASYAGWIIAKAWPLLFVAGLGLLAGIARLFHLAIWMAGIVTRFHLEDRTLTFAQLGRRARSISTADVAAIEEPQEGGRCTSVLLRDGTTLRLAFGHLDNARELALALKNTARPEVGAIEGCLNRDLVTMTAGRQLLIACLPLAIAALGGLIVVAAFHLAAQEPDRWILFPLGGLLFALGAVGFYFAVLRTWIGCVSWFRLENGVFSYRTAFSRAINQRLVEDLDRVASHRPDTPEGEAGSWKSIRFRDGERIRLHLGMLQGAPSLYETLRSASIRRLIDERANPNPTVTPTHPLWKSIEPHLERGEQVYWIGRPAPSRLWSEMAAEILLGLAFLIPFVPATALVIWIAIAKEDPGAFFGAAICALFGGLGAWKIAAPWRYRRLLGDAIYAVTSRRAIVIRGFLWGTRVPLRGADEPEQSFDARQARDYQVLRGGRDIALGGEWLPGSTGRQHWAHSGFLAPDDPEAAEAAIRHLLATATAAN